MHVWKCCPLKRNTARFPSFASNLSGHFVTEQDRVTVRSCRTAVLAFARTPCESTPQASSQALSPHDGPHSFMRDVSGGCISREQFILFRHGRTRVPNRAHFRIRHARRLTILYSELFSTRPCSALHVLESACDCMICTMQLVRRIFPDSLSDNKYTR